VFDLFRQFNQDGLQRGRMVADVAQAPAQFLAGARAVEYKGAPFSPAIPRDCVLRQDGFKGCATHGCDSGKGCKVTFGTSILLPCGAKKSRAFALKTAEFSTKRADKQPSFAKRETGGNGAVRSHSNRTRKRL